METSVSLRDIIIIELTVADIRFPTSNDADGSDAMHTDPDYSCPYVTIRTKPEIQDAKGRTIKGHGLTFTCGRGNEVVASAIETFKFLVVGQSMGAITSNFAGFYRSLTSESQIRWLGPEKGAIHLGCAAILNAIWDLWAKLEKKPVWKLLIDMEPEKLVSCIDFRYIQDALTPQQAIEILKKSRPHIKEREEAIKTSGIPAYTTSVGWLGYPDDKIRRLCKEALADGWTFFKMKVGSNIDDDIRRAGIIREEIGKDNTLAMDANQKWGVDEAIENMKILGKFNPHWIEEPTSPDDILGHATIARAIHPIGVATGEQCQNRVIFKQLLQAKSISFCQIDSCRLGSVNENIAVILMAHKFGIPVCPHAGGVGLCEFVQHLSVFDYVCVTGTFENRVTEYVDHLHEHFVFPVKIQKARYLIPLEPGYSIDMKQQSLIDYAYPNGKIWKEKH